MKNQAFAKQSRRENERKLEVILCRLTGNALNKEQRCLIHEAVGHSRQYNFHLCQSPGLPPEITERSVMVRSIFGDLNGLARGPTAILARQLESGEATNDVYIYLPNEMEETQE